MTSDEMPIQQYLLMSTHPSIVDARETVGELLDGKRSRNSRPFDIAVQTFEDLGYNVREDHNVYFVSHPDYGTVATMIDVPFNRKGNDISISISTPISAMADNAHPRSLKELEAILNFAREVNEMGIPSLEANYKQFDDMVMARERAVVDELKAAGRIQSTREHFQKTVKSMYLPEEYAEYVSGGPAERLPQRP